ncbi:hypothetical protein D7030_13740 [Flavobacteriaceae bacterium AU392]|nr:hypothetical protein D1817_04750 [Flavobacteriaceae bacterium]RKM81364.1 hypothetical protein D7030_13740 [Flavobacteriaceae bacterium AU392]
MRKLSLLLIFVSCFAFSQNKQVLYGFSELPQSLLLNPGGKINYKWHLGIPLLSQIHVNAGSSGLALNDVFADDGRDFNQKLRNAVFNLSNKDFFTLNQQLEIFSVGFSVGRNYDKKGYLSFGLYQETDIIVYFPRDYAILVLEGNQNNINRVFDLGDLSLRGELISVYHVGYNKKVSKKLTYGIRGKIYSSLATVSSINNRGSFVTRPGENNFFDHIFNLDLELQTSGIASLSEDGTEGLGQKLLLGNLGLGLDAGFTYQLSEQLAVDASIQDIGFIRHSKDIENFEVKGDLVFEGINPLFPGAEDNESVEDNIRRVSEDFDNLFEVDTTTTKFTTIRPIKFNAAVKYDFGEKIEEECNCMKKDKTYLNAIGLQLYGIKRPQQPQFALTAFYYRKLFNTLNAKVTYTIDSFSSRNVGLGISTHLGNFNFYVIADNLLEYQNLANAQNVSLQLGFNLIFNKK